MVEAEMDSGETRTPERNRNKNNYVEATLDEMGPLETRSRCV
jgi:hypothetical protein